MRAVNIILNYENTDFAIGYEKYLNEAFSELSVKELNEMERDFFKSLTVENHIITHKPLNNTNYQPLQGA